jgi:opacity protein-like surface antigen
MKKIFLSAVFALVAFTTLSAQGTFKFGATGGLLHSNSNFNLDVVLTDFKLATLNETGFYIGAIAELGLSEKLSIQPELTYGSAGDLSFIYLPIMAKVKVAQGLNVQFGPQLNFNSNVDEIKQLINEIDANDDQNSYSDALKSSAFDLGFGLGYDVNDHFAVQARYAFPLTNRYDGPGNSLLEIKNNTLNVGVAYFF